MYTYAIGLDIGITSVGWATLALDEKENPFTILGMGSRIFDAAEQPKTGASLATPRREARSARRRLRRHRHRNERIRALLISSGLLSEAELATLFEGKLEDVYLLRVLALDKPVTRSELARILIHLSQRRGFRSNRKSAVDNEDGKLLEAVNENKRRMQEAGYRTAGEMMLRDPTFFNCKRNKGGNYLSTVTRDMTADEVHKIFTAQRRFGSEFAGEDFENAYLEILLSQRSFDDGPGGNSPYSGSQIEKMVGVCQFEPNEPRAAKATYSFEYFNLLQRINQIRIISGGEGRTLTAEQRNQLIELAHKTENLDYSKIRKVLSIPPTEIFNTVRYLGEQSAEEVEKKEKFCYLRAYHQIRKALDKVEKGRIAYLPRTQINSIGAALSLYKTSTKIRERLQKDGLETCDIDAAELLGGFSKFGHLSVKACNKIIPFLEQGMNYSDACTAAGYAFKGHENGKTSVFLHPTNDDFADITSPVVRRAVSQTIKVVNAIIREQGCSPTYVNIELAREMAKDFVERKKLEKDMKENQARNERMMERIRTEYGQTCATGQDLVKLKLYEEQGGVCMYSQKQMSLEHLFDPDYAEVDHIIPYSISFDDSYKNKVIVLTKENRDKRNYLPLEYLTGERRDRFVVWVNNTVHDKRKRQLLLKECLTEEDQAKFKVRNLQDTKTMSRFLLNYINDNLEFATSLRGRKKRVTAVNGSVTAYMRKRWGITKIREDGDLHHAVDAVVIACTTDGMIQEVSRYAALRECEYTQADGKSIAMDPSTGKQLQTFPYPWHDFRRELEARLSKDPVRVITDYKLPAYLVGDRIDTVKPLFVSRMPQRKVTGAAHKDTVKSSKALGNGLAVVKKPLTNLKLDKQGEIADYYMPQSDRLLYEALKARLIKFDGSGSKAFAEPFYKPKHDGTLGPVVNKVKLCEKTTLNVAVQNGAAIADHDTMVRIDVFYVGGDGYYLVPIYVADTLKPELPNRACIAHKQYSEWQEMSDKNFIFSLFPNDLICVTHRNKIRLTKVYKESTLPETLEIKSEFLYYKCANISSGAISCINHDNTYTIDSLGIKTLEKFEKYTVDVLGNLHQVKEEKRQPFCIRRS